MAPISLFFGSNSSGKSSIGHFLMMLKQTVELADRKAVFYPGGKNSAVQLGSYQQMVYHHDPGNRIKFEYRWDTYEDLSVRDPVTQEVFSGDTLSFQAEVGPGEKQDENSLVLASMKYELLDSGKLSLSVALNRKPGIRPEYTVESEKYPLVRKTGRSWSLKGAVRFYGFPDEVAVHYQNADFVQEFNLQQEILFRSLWYIGPLRTKAERLYSWTGMEPESVGFAGENTIAALLAARRRKISLGGRSRAKPFEEIIAMKLKQMNLIEEFTVNRISEQRQEYEVKVRTKGSIDWVDLPDVGFGVSQVLPVLVQCFYAPPGSVIVMEQPEIHLHPNAQSALADVMIDVINSRENGEDRNIQLVIETHSEHFLRRLQRRIAENTVAKHQVSAFFANIDKTPAALEPLKIDTYGAIRNWPKNFFGDEMDDITEQAKAAMKRRIRQKEG